MGSLDNAASAGLPADGECHLWSVWLSRATSPDERLFSVAESAQDGQAGLRELAAAVREMTGAEAERLLDGAERQRLPRFRVESARQTFLASRALQRLAAAHYAGRDPAGIVIDRTCEHCGGDHGKPRAGSSPVDYSVSHAGDLLVIAVVGSGRVGVDVEQVATRATDLDDLAKTIMTAAELARYRAARQYDRPALFYRTWTRKEAAVKLTGHGLSQHLADVDVTSAVVPAGTIRKPSADYDIYLRDLSCDQGYSLALASTAEIASVRYLLGRPFSPAQAR